MTGPTHILFGVASGVALCRGLDWHITPVELICLFLGSLGPDIDADSGSITKPGRIFQGFLPRPIANFLDELGGVVGAIARRISGHRGFFHTPVVAAFLFTLSFILQSRALGWFSVGYLSHILADACTVRGVPLCWPLKNKEYSLLPIRTGSAKELVVAIGLGAFVIVVGWPLLPESTREGFRNIREAVEERQMRNNGRRS